MSNEKHYVTKEDLTEIVKGMATNIPEGTIHVNQPIGTIQWQYYVMENYIALDGSNLIDASTDYAELLLFAQTKNLIGTTEQYTDNKLLFKYDSTNDILTLPDFTGLVPQGAATVGEIKAGLPNISGYASIRTNDGVGAAGLWYGFGAFETGKMDDVFPASDMFIQTTTHSKTTKNRYLGINASNSSSIYSDSINTVQPPAAGLIPQIKYKPDLIEESASNSTPIGTIIAYMGTTAPRHYKICDGTVYNIADYIELATFIKNEFGSYDFFGGDGTTTFAVPDLRGEFLRGTGTNSHSGQGNGASVGVHQNGTKIPNVNKATTSAGIQVNTMASDAATQDVLPVGVDKFSPRTGYITVSSTNSSFNSPNDYGAYTTRPTNTSVLYCIKYKNADYVRVETPVSSDNYSTTEQRIGTWIDGKPLYQITIQDTMPVVTTEGTAVSKTVDIDGLKIENLVSYEGIIKTSIVLYHLDSFHSLSDNKALFEFSSVFKNDTTKTYYDSIGLKSSRVFINNEPVYITLKYTKTTDN